MNSPAQDLFARALELPGAERDTFLMDACGGDAELHLEVRHLLVDAARADDFFGDADGVTLGAQDFQETYAEKEGDKIGPYKLLQAIGEGGFGVVWMAEQSVPISRKVALKVIKAGMDTKQVLARFEAERQALAMMDHPNIAKVLDAGATDSGRPYFAMELVKGIPITDYCDEAGLGTKERLALFGDVCAAIQHAHQKGIIHRDIKPSNVMVTLYADKPVMKVIDFGIAKATQGKLTDKTLFTRFEQFIGTPAYMSPEEAGPFHEASDLARRAEESLSGIKLADGPTRERRARLVKAVADEERARTLVAAIEEVMMRESVIPFAEVDQEAKAASLAAAFSDFAIHPLEGQVEDSRCDAPGCAGPPLGGIDGLVNGAGKKQPRSIRASGRSG